jgi:hypothetical protein
MKKNKLIYGVIGVVLIAGAAFYGGMKYGSSMSATNANPSGAGGFAGRNMGGAGNRMNRPGGNGFSGGEIISVDSQGLTIKLRDGGSQIIFLSASSSVQKMVDGARDDLKAGENVTIVGTSNADGSITAQSVQIRPATPIGGGLGQPMGR